MGVLIVNPVDSDAVAPAVKSAMSQGIKVIAVDRGVNGVDVDCQIASDNGRSQDGNRVSHGACGRRRQGS